MANQNLPDLTLADPKSLEALAAQDFEACYGKAMVAELEECSKGFGVDRRVLQALLAQDKAEIMARIHEPEVALDAFRKMLDLAREYRAHLEGLMEQVEVAEARILCLIATISKENSAEEEATIQ